MIHNLGQLDLPIAAEEVVALSVGTGNVFRDIKDVIPAMLNGPVTEVGQEDLERVWVTSIGILLERFDCSPPQFRVVRGCVVDGALCHQCQSQCKVETQLGSSLGTCWALPWWMVCKL